MGGGRVQIPGEKHYEGVAFNVISVTHEGWVGLVVNFPEKVGLMLLALRGVHG